MFATFGADHRAGVTAVSTRTYIVSAVITGFTVLTEQRFSAYTVNTRVTATAYIRIRTVGAFFVTIRTYCGAIRATITAIAYCLNTVPAVVTFITPTT